jgi:DNA-binding beta-propeller fold protein YncE
VEGIISTVVGTGEPGFTGDSGPATAARLFLPFGIAIDRAGNLYVVDNGNKRVRKVVGIAAPGVIGGQ